MERRSLQGGKLVAGSYDEPAKQLRIEFQDGSARLFKGVPGEVWRRLIAAPNAGSYFEDRIADEYPNEPASAATNADTRAKLDELFGGGTGKD